MYSKIIYKVYLLLDPKAGGTIWDRVINTVLVTLIISNVIAVILETVDSIYVPNKTLFDNFDNISVLVFSIEYVLRIWSCTSNEKYKHPLSGRIKYIFSAGALIDLIAILPFYLPLLASFDLRFLRILRLTRFLRIFKLGRYVSASRVMIKVFESKKEELVLGFVMTIFLIFVASSVMYFAEHNAQPEKFSSIPETMWWSVATLTTVGYGDMFPITTLGKTLTSIISILGIGLFALPAGILASGFSEEFRKRKKKAHCPHCGKEIE